MYGIDDKFIEDLNSGKLSYFLNRVKKDNRISLEVRKKAINLYYRGGSALKICKQAKGYKFIFDEKYCLEEEKRLYFSKLDKHDSTLWIDNFELILNEMDEWFKIYDREERELQQKLSQIYSDTYVIDIEHTVPNNGGKRIDMVGLVKEDDKYKILLIEFKVGIKSIKGLAQHYEDYLEIITCKKKQEELVNSIIEITSNKHDLGLIDFEIKESDINIIEILLLLHNYNYKSKTLDNELNQIPNSDKPFGNILHIDDKSFEIKYKKSVKLKELVTN